jgi:hypothetical protein
VVVTSANTTTSPTSGSAILGEERVLTWVDGPEEGDGVPGCGGEPQPGEGLSYDKSSWQRPTARGSFHEKCTPNSCNEATSGLWSSKTNH